MSLTYSSPIFGPIHSRRLGISLGINLMPSDGKVCNFDCIYCEVGLNKDKKAHKKRPTREEVYNALENKLIEMQNEGALPDVLTFAGNGEPAAHPQFDVIIDDTIRLRDKYCKNAKVSVLTNATLITRQKVFEALAKVDNNILKLDTVDEEYIKMVDRPTGNYNVRDIIEKMKEYNGSCIIQTMFLKGECEGVDINNTISKYVEPWLDAIDYIKPRQVMIYTIDRETPYSTLKKATHEELDSIAEKISSRGLNVSVSY